MADPVRGSSAPDPGVGGALKDLVKQAALTFGPKSVTQIKARNDADEAEAESGDRSDVLGRMRAAQSTDKDNSYQY